MGVGAVIVRDGQVLIVKRRYEPLAGRWSLPGGTLELGRNAGIWPDPRDARGNGARGGRGPGD